MTGRACSECHAIVYARGFCRQHYQQWYHHKNADKLNQATRSWRTNNQERVQTYKQAWNAANPEKLRAIQSTYRARLDPDRTRSYMQAWRHANRVKKRTDNRAWADANPEKARIAIQRWGAANKDKLATYYLARRGRKSNANGFATTKQVADRMAYYGGRCWMCGEVGNTIDHVKPLSKGGSNWPANLRPACRSCNSKKGAKWNVAAAQ